MRQNSDEWPYYFELKFYPKIGLFWRLNFLHLIPMFPCHGDPIVLHWQLQLAICRNQFPLKRSNDHDESSAYEGYTNPEPGFQSGPEDYVDAD